MLYTDSNDNGILHAVYLSVGADRYGHYFNYNEEDITQAALAGEAKANFYLTNAFRRYHDLSPLTWSNAAARSAALHSQDMARQDYFDHYSLDGRSPFDRMAAQGISRSAMAENIAAGSLSGLEAYNGWVNSAGHRQNMLTTSCTYLGVGAAYSESAEYGFYYTQNFHS
jgi:uncharacterized protein YkwD